MTSSVAYSSVSVRIVLTFIQFLSSVQASPWVDRGKIEEVIKSLKSIFNIDESMVESTTQGAPFYDLFNNDVLEPNGSASQGRVTQIGLPLVYLFHDFQMALTALGFFNCSGKNYLQQKSYAKRIFKEAISALMIAGHENFNRVNLAEGMKILGNHAMRYDRYARAIVMYTCAIALRKNNLIYFCHRAAACMKYGKFKEAVQDCNEAIKQNPRFSLAYFRLGCVYYEQGKNFDAIQAFIKVLDLKPHYEAAIEKIRLADSKLIKELVLLREKIESIVGDDGGGAPVTEEDVDWPWEVVDETVGVNDDSDDGIEEDFVEVHLTDTPPPDE